MWELALLTMRNSCRARRSLSCKLMHNEVRGSIHFLTWQQCVCVWVKVCEKQRQWERKPGAYPAYIGVRPHSFRTSVDRATHWSYCVNCTQSVQSVCSEPQFYRRIAAQIWESLNMKSSSEDLNVKPLWFWVNITLLFVDGSTAGPSSSGLLYMLRRYTDRAPLKVILSVLKWGMTSLDCHESDLLTRDLFYSGAKM